MMSVGIKILKVHLNCRFRVCFGNPYSGYYFNIFSWKRFQKKFESIKNWNFRFVLTETFLSHNVKTFEWNVNSLYRNEFEGTHITIRIWRCLSSNRACQWFPDGLTRPVWEFPGLLNGFVLASQNDSFKNQNVRCSKWPLSRMAATL